MKLIIRIKPGLKLLRPSRLHHKLAYGDGGLRWQETREQGRSRRLYPREEEVEPGRYELERVDNPFLAGGEPWLVLKGTRIGAAEPYFKQLAEATRGTRNGVEISLSPSTPGPGAG